MNTKYFVVFCLSAVLSTIVHATSQSTSTNTTAVQNATTQNPAGQVSTNAPNGNKNNPQQSTPKPSVKTKLTTAAPKQCIYGECVASGTDESCLGNIKPRCNSSGTCIKTITKNGTHSMFKVECGKTTTCTTMSTSTTTTKPAPATTTTSSCCEESLCNQFVPNTSDGLFSINILHLVGFIVLVAFL